MEYMIFKSKWDVYIPLTVKGLTAIAYESMTVSGPRFIRDLAESFLLTDEIADVSYRPTVVDGASSTR